MITVLLVHQLDAPDCQVLVGLCSEHAQRLERATWVGIDELVGFSSRMDCEACALIDGRLLSGPAPFVLQDFPAQPLQAVPRRRISDQFRP